MYVHHQSQKRQIGEPTIEKWKVRASTAATNTGNLIREIVDKLHIEPNPNKSVIALSLGDPTVYGNLRAPREATKAIIDIVEEGSYNGYTLCVGYERSRQAVADYLSHDGVKFQAKDVILCNGCTAALDLCITVLTDPTKNHNILLPKPGFSIYRTVASSLGVNMKYYNLLPQNKWEIDLDHLESLIDANTAAIILNNPSNPCGSVYSETHLRNFLEIAQRHRIPVIADEIYEQIVFSGRKFVSTASLNSGVPILICGGISKRFLVPGWRLGWIVVHDEIGAFESEIRKGLDNLTQRTIGLNTLVQAALPRILLKTPQSFHDNLINVLENNVNIAYGTLLQSKGLTPYMSDGTMYMIVGIQLERFPFENGLEFVMKLMEEESVLCLPGECFQAPGFMRIVITVPDNLLKEACDRIVEFCNRYYLVCRNK